MKKTLLILLISLIGQISYSQDPSFVQFDLNMMYMNPAFVGYEKEYRILIHRRNQWVGIPEKFNTNIIEFGPFYLQNDKNGILGKKSAKGWETSISPVEQLELIEIIEASGNPQVMSS